MVAVLDSLCPRCVACASLGKAGAGAACPVTEPHHPPQELLADWQLRKRPRSLRRQLRQGVALGLGWLLCLGATMGCTVAVLTFSEVMIQVRKGTERPVAEVP